MPTPTYRANVTNREQDVLEQATYEGGINVQTGDAKTRVVMKERQGGTERTANDQETVPKKAGVVMPWDDMPGKFMNEKQGRA